MVDAFVVGMVMLVVGMVMAEDNDSISLKVALYNGDKLVRSYR